MPKCVYCGTVYDIPRGLTLVMNDGRIQYLCSSKCRKNMLMKRRKVRWISKSDENKVDMSARKNKISVNVEEKSD
ncbi:MAG: 50S ribosomal protein L24e [Nanoarchaeota archaeon]